MSTCLASLFATSHFLSSLQKMPGDVASLTRDHAIDWVNRYGKAWQEQSVQGILDLFTEDGEYVERPYDTENGIYRGHAGIANYWITHIQARERHVHFTHHSEDMVLDAEKGTCMAKWEARFDVRPAPEKPWKTVQFLQVAKLCFADDGRVQHFEEYWHGKSFQHASKGLRDPRARRGRCGVKRKLPDLEGATCCNECLHDAFLGPFSREALRLEARKVKESQVHHGYMDETLPKVPVVYNAISKVLKVPKDEDFISWYRRLANEQLVEESDMKGIPLLRPWGAHLWDEACHFLRQHLRCLGAQFFILPISSHGTSDGGNVSPFVVREAAEGLLYKVLAKSIKSMRDLPLVLMRFSVAVASKTDVKRPVPLLRSGELALQEEETEEFLEQVLRVYLCLCRDLFCLHAFVQESAGRRSVHVRIRDGDSIEVATVKNLGRKMAEDFKMSYTSTEAGAENRVCVLSYFACTVRLIAATVCTFGDALGCCWPPKVAPLQVVIIPMMRYQDRVKDEVGQHSLQRILEWCEEARHQLESESIRVKSDVENETPGKRIRHWISRGVPLVLTVQLAEGASLLANVRMTARDMPGVEVSSQVATASVEAAKEAMKQLEEPNTVPCRWRMQNSGKTTRILNLHFPREKKDSLQKTK
eukprot:symbB.v1.2.023659.t2/scaffold2181.1/size92752/3